MAAVGRRGTAWWYSDGDWVAMPKKPSTSGEDLQGVHYLTSNFIMAVGGRGRHIRMERHHVEQAYTERRPPKSRSQRDLDRG